MANPTYIIGTSGYSFPDWVGPFYPPGTRSSDMFEYYARQFAAVELNFTYYRMPEAGTLERLARLSPPAFQFWVKANQEATHKQNRQVAQEFVENLTPLAEAGKLAGILLQFPQGFHRTQANRKYLADAVRDLERYPLAVEFRHGSWEEPSVAAAMRDRHITLVVPDVPDIPELYHSPPAVTTEIGYWRLHSREAGKWYSGRTLRYDYSYSENELRPLVRQWNELEANVERTYVFFNNCHRGQAVQGAWALRAIVEEIVTGR